MADYISAERAGTEPSAGSVLIIAGLALGDDRLPLMVRAAGARLLGVVPLDQGAKRLEALAAADLVLLACPEPGASLSSLTEALAKAVAEGQQVIVLTSLATLDEIDAALGTGSAAILCEAAPEDIALSLTAALFRPQPSVHLGEGDRDRDVRLARLSEEIARISRELGAMTAGEARVAAPSPPYRGEPAGGGADGAAVTPAQFRDLLRVRRQRDVYFPGEIFADPAWDMMLDLMAARLSGQKVTVSSLCAAAAVPPTTALRWIKQLTDRGFFLRQPDIRDGRRIFVALSDYTAEAMALWLQASRRTLRNI